MRLGKRERAERKARLARVARVDGCPIRTSMQEHKLVGKQSADWSWKPKRGPKSKVRMIVVE